MGCVSSTLLSQEEDFSQIGGSAGFTHHIVSLTSTTYGLLTLDPPTTTVPPTPTPPPRITLASLFPSPLSEPRSLTYESINSWDLMSGLDPEHLPSFRISSQPLIRPNSDKQTFNSQGNEENSCPNVTVPHPPKSITNRYEMICPPNGENKVVVYTTSLRGVRKTFDDCNAVRSALEGFRVLVCERDISMDRGFREELKELMSGRDSDELIPPRVFVKGRYVGGAEAVMAAVEEGVLAELLQGIPRVKDGYVCEGCGGARFLPCFSCNGSCKMVVAVEEDGEEQGRRSLNVKCGKCNENGLVHCPICS